MVEGSDVIGTVCIMLDGGKGTGSDGGGMMRYGRGNREGQAAITKGQ